MRKVQIPLSPSRHDTTCSSALSISASAALTHYQQRAVQMLCCKRFVYCFGSCILLQSLRFCYRRKTLSTQFRVKIYFVRFVTWHDGPSGICA